MNVSKSTRFEVFKRDTFTCQYCGRRTPDVVLEIDHIVPRVQGGTNDPENLATACFDCNRGKGPRSLARRVTKAVPQPHVNSEDMERFHYYAQVLRTRMMVPNRRRREARAETTP